MAASPSPTDATLLSLINRVARLRRVRVTGVWPPSPPLQDELIRLTFTHEALLPQIVPIFEHLGRGTDALPLNARLAEPPAAAVATATATPAVATLALGAVNTRLLTTLVLVVLALFGERLSLSCTSILIALYYQRPEDCLAMLVPQLYPSALARKPVLQVGGRPGAELMPSTGSSLNLGAMVVTVEPPKVVCMTCIAARASGGGASQTTIARTHAPPPPPVRALSSRSAAGAHRD